MPRSSQRRLGAVAEKFGVWTSRLRILPSFAIVGGQRCGTNSLYEYLQEHPSVARALPIPEVHFFDLNFDRGLGWYRGHFPTSAWASLRTLRGSSKLITGESSPYYMFHPHAGRRLADTLPNIKLFVMLRNPAERAYSHYHHERTRGYETLTFEEAIAEEPARLRNEIPRMREDPSYQSFNHQHFSYLARGDYFAQLETLFSLFPRDNIQVLFSEELFSEPARVHAKALRFLGLSERSALAYKKHNTGMYGGIHPETRARLMDHFEESNGRLYRLLDCDFRWD